MWDTTGFNNIDEWPEDGSQPFVLSMGDATGYGQHGDYVFGWKDDALQKAMDASCYGASCGDLKTQEVVSADKCVVPITVDEVTEGCKSNKLHRAKIRAYLTILTRAHQVAG